METSYTHQESCGCGCKGSGLGDVTSFTQSGCGCTGGLGETQAPETRKDLISEAKKYINGEIPTSYKIAGGIALILLLTLATRGN